MKLFLFKGFGGKFGVQQDRQDKSAVGWDHHEAPQKHESQIDHKVVSINYVFIKFYLALNIKLSLVLFAITYYLVNYSSTLDMFLIFCFFRVLVVNLVYRRTEWTNQQYHLRNRQRRLELIILGLNQI